MRLAVKSVRRARGSHCLARSLIGLPHWEAEFSLSPQSHVICVGGRESPIGLPRLAGRESPIGLPCGRPCVRVRSASHGWPAMRVRSSGQSHLYRVEQPDRPEDQTLTAGQPWEADWTLTASHTASQIGLS